MRQINHVKIRIPDLFLHLQTLGDVRKDTIRKYYNKGKVIRNKLYKYTYKMEKFPNVNDMIVNKPSHVLVASRICPQALS